MKWHIYDLNDKPLCFSDMPLEFDTQSDAIEFLQSGKDIEKQTLILRKDILLHKGLKFNATNYRYGDSDIMLVRIR